MVKGLHYDATTYAAIIGQLERHYGGMDQEIASMAAELFKGQKVQLTPLESVRSFRVKLASYGVILDTYGKREAKFSRNSQLYQELQERKFTQQDIMKFHDRRSNKKWKDSVEGILDWMDHHQTILESSQQGSKAPTTFQKEILNTAFTAIEGHNVLCKTNEAAAHQVALDEQFVFMIYEDTPDEVVNHMLQITQKSGRNYTKISPCDWKGNECADDHLMRDCPTYKALNDKEKLDHILNSGRCFN
jgi:hypothetical protein